MISLDMNETSKQQNKGEKTMRIKNLKKENWKNVEVRFPQVNKNCTIEENDEQISRSSHVRTCKVIKDVHLNQKEWKDWCLMGSVEWLKDTCEHFEEEGKNGEEIIYSVVQVRTKNEVLYVDTQGYDYARYAGRPAYAYDPMMIEKLEKQMEQKQAEIKAIKDLIGFYKGAYKIA